MITKTSRKIRVRHKLAAGSGWPRFSVFRSNKALYAQIIDDKAGNTLAAAWGKRGGEVGEKLAKMAVEKGVAKVKFDRGGYAYHGRVKDLAESARAGGLKF